MGAKYRLINDADVIDLQKPGENAKEKEEQEEEEETERGEKKRGEAVYLRPSVWIYCTLYSGTQVLPYLHVVLRTRLFSDRD